MCPRPRRSFVLWLSFRCAFRLGRPRARLNAAPRLSTPHASTARRCNGPLFGRLCAAGRAPVLRRSCGVRRRPRRFAWWCGLPWLLLLCGLWSMWDVAPRPPAVLGGHTRITDPEPTTTGTTNNYQLSATPTASRQHPQSGQTSDGFRRF